VPLAPVLRVPTVPLAPVLRVPTVPLAPVVTRRRAVALLLLVRPTAAVVRW
jgi:hypothetical protein